MSTLWLVRHAPVLGEAGICYGRTDLACAVEATRAVAATVAPLLPHGIALYSSPLQRCKTLAAAIAQQRPDLAVETDPRLAEMDFGSWEGRRWDAIDRAEFDRWMADFADGLVGGNGESTRAFMSRVGAAWDDWLASGRDAVWVTHAGVMRAVLLLQQGVRCPGGAGEWPSRAIGFGEWMRVEIGVEIGDASGMPPIGAAGSA